MLAPVLMEIFCADFLLLSMRDPFYAVTFSKISFCVALSILLMLFPRQKMILQSVYEHESVLDLDVDLTLLVFL